MHKRLTKLAYSSWCSELPSLSPRGMLPNLDVGRPILLSDESDLRLAVEPRDRERGRVFKYVVDGSRDWI